MRAGAERETYSAVTLGFFFIYQIYLLLCAEGQGKGMKSVNVGLEAQGETDGPA